ncbi:MAG: hypothetical protein KC425_18255 [Anaerolineales bacterium]|nr:hypothetical protein [Anaerolineales bacterium]
MDKGTQERIQFSVRAEPRHPGGKDAYDPLAHRYRDGYVRPPGWWLHLEMGATPLPENVAAYTWTVTQSEGDFRYEAHYDDKVTSVEDVSVEVPAEGQYVVHLAVTLKNGRRLIYERQFCLRDYLVVALGDSYFCGEGNPDVPGEPNPLLGPVACNLATFTKFLVEKTPVQIPMRREAEWQEKHAHRSYRSGPALAADWLEIPSLGVVVTFLNFARSGSSIEQGLLAPREDEEWTDIGQIEEAARAVGDRPIDALLLSVGGNDIDFSDRLIDLIRDDLMLVGAGGGMGDDELNRRQELNEAKRRLAELPGRLDMLAEALQQLNTRQVYLMEYPTAQFEVINDQGEVVVSSGCGIFDGPDMDIDGKDAQLIKESGRKLNRKLRHAAQKYGWVMVRGVDDAFAGHGLCAEDAYFISAEESCKTQGDFRGTMHPNQKGHEAYGRCIQRALNLYTISPDLSIDTAARA